MPNVITPGHMSITVSGVKTKLNVNPTTYQQVDIVDFAPRMTAGTQMWNRLGTYVDVGQESFKHGFGQWEQAEPQMYSYSGQHIDARQGWIQLGTEQSTVKAATASWYVNDLVEYNGVVITADSTGLGAIKPSDGTYAQVSLGAAEVRDLLHTGKYLFASRAGRMQLLWVGQPDGINATTLTFSTPDPEFTADQFNGGTLWVFDGTGAGHGHTITDTTTDEIIVGGGWGGNTPDATSWVMAIGNAGVGANPPDHYDKMIVFGGYMWAAQENSNYLHYWAEENGSDAEGNGTADANVVKVGPPGGVIVNLASFNNQLLVFRKDGVWALNEQETDALAYHTLSYDTEAHEDNFDVCTQWQGFIVYSVRNRVYKFRSGAQDVTPPVWNENPPFKQFGGFKGGIPKGKFFFMLGKSNAANADEALETTAGFVSLLATDGVGWHKLMTLPVTAPTRYGMWLDPTNDYLYLFAYDNTSKGTLWKVRLQTYSDLPYATYPTTGNHYLYTSYFNFGMERIQKHFASLTLHGELAAGQYVTVSYRTDANTTWTALGTNFTSDLQEISFPTTVTGRRIQFKLDLVTTSAASTPIVKAVILKVMMRPEVKWGVRCDIILGDSLHDQRGLALGKTGAATLAALETARDSVAPFTLVDLFGTSRTAYLASMSVEPIMYEDSNAIESVARCTFVFD